MSSRYERHIARSHNRISREKTAREKTARKRSTAIPSHKTLVRLRKDVLNSARVRLLRCLEEDAEAREDIEPIIIAENISLEAYAKYCKARLKIPASIRLINGKIVAHEVPLTVHAAVLGQIICLVGVGNNHLAVGSRHELIVTPDSYFTADVTFRPRDLRPPAGKESYPTMVVDVGHCESISSLHNLATGYFSPQTTIGIYLAIKLFPCHQDGTMAMLALRYLRTNPTPMLPDVAISFGTRGLHQTTVSFLLGIGIPDAAITGVGRHADPPCDALDIPNYQLSIPIPALFDGALGGIPAGAGKVFNLDLWELQRRALEH